MIPNSEDTNYGFCYSQAHPTSSPKASKLSNNDSSCFMGKRKKNQCLLIETDKTVRKINVIFRLLLKLALKEN